MSDSWLINGKQQAVEALLGINTHQRSEADRTYWAQRCAELQQAAAKESDAGRVGLSFDKVLHVLDRLVTTANPDSLRTDQAVSQLMARTGLSETTVKRCLAVLRDCDLVPVLSNGGGPNKRPAVRWLKFVDEYRQRTQAAAPVDSDRTQVTSDRTQVIFDRTQATSGTPYRVTTEPPYPSKAEAERNGAAGSHSGGGKEKQKEGSGSWCDQVAWNVAAGVLAHEKEQGRAEQVRDADAVIRKHKLPAAQEWVRKLMARSDSDQLQLLAPSDRDLITWGVSAVLGEGGGWAARDAVERAQQLWEQHQATRPAMGAAG